MSEYFDAVRPTYIEAWPSELMRLSFATKLLPLHPCEVECLRRICHLTQYNEGEQPDKMVLGELRARLDAGLAEFPSAAFVRLGSRSPKDSWAAREGRFRYRYADDVLYWFAESERIYEDLCLAQSEAYTPYIALREYKMIDPAAEFRCFIKGGRIVAVSQYDHFQHFPRMAAEAESIRWAIDSFQPLLRDALHVNPVVVDLWVRQRCRPHSNEVEWSVTLVEINPYFVMTDPCLFDWRDEADWSQAQPYELRFKR